MSKNDPHVRELLRKNQFAEALRYYRTRYQTDRADAMRILQEIQNELSGKPPTGLVDTKGAPIASSQPAPQAPPPAQPRPEPPKAEAPRPAPEPPKPAPVAYQTAPREMPSLSNDHTWNALPAASKQELQRLLEEGRVLDAIRSYWYGHNPDLRASKENVLRWSLVFPPKL